MASYIVQTCARIAGAHLVVPSHYSLVHHWRESHSEKDPQYLVLTTFCLMVCAILQELWGKTSVRMWAVLSRPYWLILRKTFTTRWEFDPPLIVPLCCNIAQHHSQNLRVLRIWRLMLESGYNGGEHSHWWHSEQRGAYLCCVIQSSQNITWWPCIYCNWIHELEVFSSILLLLLSRYVLCTIQFLNAPTGWRGGVHNVQTRCRRSQSGAPHIRV
jgi:hypothetical protein